MMIVAGIVLAVISTLTWVFEIRPALDEREMNRRIRHNTRSA